MSDPTCVICGRAAPHGENVIIILTEAEKAQLPDPRDEYIYCKPCWSILSNPVSGPALMSGIAQHHLRQLGVSNPEQAAARFRSRLSARAIRKS